MVKTRFMPQFLCIDLNYNKKHVTPEPYQMLS